MKRTAGTMMLLAGLGGCVSPDGANTAGTGVKPFNQAYHGIEAPGYMGSGGEPLHLTASSVRGAPPSGVVQASAMAMPPNVGVQQVADWGRRNNECNDCNAHTPGILGRGGFGHGGRGHGGQGTVDPYAAGPMGHGIGTMLGNNGIMPAPSMGPPGAVAAIGAIGAGMPYGPVQTNQRTSIKFVNPQGMRVTWLGPAGYIEPGLTAPATYNFLQGSIYRLRLSGIPGRPGKVYYPTLEISPVTAKTMTFLAHNTVPVAFTDDDLERVNSGNLVVKVIYLPEPQFQDLAAIAGAEELVSTQLQPGEDPVIEATRRGTILSIIRIGNIDLENPFSPAMDSVPPPPAAPTMPLTAPGMPPGTLPPPPATLPRPAVPAPTTPGTPTPATPKTTMAPKLVAPKTAAAPKPAATKIAAAPKPAAPKPTIVQASQTEPAPKKDSKGKAANLWDAAKSVFTK